MIEFQIKENSPTPVIKQIQEQIKLSISMGMLKRGDILPSIREVEKQTGINRGKIHRAFLALQKSGLLSPVPGRRTSVAISVAAPASVNKKCQQLNKEIIQRIRRIGVSPVAYARYLGRGAQEDERKFPFIAYVDWEKSTAVRRAEQTSQRWQASVVGLSVDEFKLALARGTKIRKVLVNHLTYDFIRSLSRSRRIDVIPIEITHTAQTVRALQKIRADSSVLIVFSNYAQPIVQIVLEQLRKLLKCKKDNISWVVVNEAADFEKLLKDPRYDRILVSPDAQNKVPLGQRRNARLLQFQVDFTPEGLEIARIRAGVIL